MMKKCALGPFGYRYTQEFSIVSIAIKLEAPHNVKVYLNI
jgi:hypothetical protein